MKLLYIDTNKTLFWWYVLRQGLLAAQNSIQFRALRHKAGVAQLVERDLAKVSKLLPKLPISFKFPRLRPTKKQAEFTPLELLDIDTAKGVPSLQRVPEWVAA